MLNLFVSANTDGDVEIRAKGKLRYAESTTVANCLNSLIRVHKRVVINLAELDAIDAAGIGVLAAAYQRGLGQGTAVSLSRVPGRVRELLELARLGHLLSNQAAAAA